MNAHQLVFATPADEGEWSEVYSVEEKVVGCIVRHSPLFVDEHETFHLPAMFTGREIMVLGHYYTENNIMPTLVKVRRHPINNGNATLAVRMTGTGLVTVSVSDRELYESLNVVCIKNNDVEDLLETVHEQRTTRVEGINESDALMHFNAKLASFKNNDNELSKAATWQGHMCASLFEAIGHWQNGSRWHFERSWESLLSDTVDFRSQFEHLLEGNEHLLYADYVLATRLTPRAFKRHFGRFL